jgi:penicillin-binding protein 2
MGYKPSQQIGKSGLELQYETILRGTEGSRFVEVDARNRVVREIGVRAERPAVAGGSLKTNIDLTLQRHIAKLFGDSIDGSAVVINPKTGGVLAIHSAPGYNPNHFIGGISTAEFRSLNEDPRRPLLNKALQGIYAPGSTWKLATAIIALERGRVGVHEVMPVKCTGGYQMGNRRWRCWDKGGHGALDLLGAIRNSCDVYFYQLGQRLTFDTLIAGGRKLGFGSRTGIDLPYEGSSDFPPAPTPQKAALRDSLESVRDASGKRLSPATIDSLFRVLGDSTIDIIAYYNRKFRPGGWSAQAEELNLSIGQGANSATLISMARFYTALATDGRMARPMLVGDTPDTTRIFRISDEALRELRTAMVGVVSAGGTAASANIKGLSFGGKTGSAQNPQNPARDHAWFVGFAPAEDPQIVVGVFVEFGLHGYIAARIAKQIVEFHFKRSVTAAPTQTGN